MSCPKITLHNSISVTKQIKNQYVKRNQKDYNLSFKRVVLQEVENGLVSNLTAMRKYDIYDHGIIPE